MKKVFVVATARIDYVAKGEEVVINSTAGSGFGVGDVFSPGWKLVKASKAGRISWDEYVEKYLEILRAKWRSDEWAFREAVESGHVVLVCYCGRKTNGRSCHRYLLKDALIKAARHWGYEVEDRGEVLNYQNRRQSYDKK